MPLVAALLLAANVHAQDDLASRVSAARDAGAAGLALELANRQPSAFSAVEYAALRHAALAQRLRAAQEELRQSSSAGRTDPVDAALTDGWTLLAELPTRREFDDVRRNVVHDMIFGLALRGRADEAIVLFEWLDRPLPEIPAYVLVAAGDAYEYRERLDEAIACYETALAMAGPGDIERGNVRERLFYAYLDRGRDQDARLQLSMIEHESPPYVEWAPVPETPNTDYERAQRLQAQYLLYTGRIDAGIVAIDTLRHDAPFSTGLRNVAADARMGDGRPRAARERYRSSLAEHPADSEAMIGLARASLALRDIATAREISEGLSERLPEVSSVRHLRRDVDVYDSPQLIMQGAASRGSERSETGARNEWMLDTTIYTAPIADHWRLYFNQFTSRAALDDTHRSRVRNGAGVEYRNEWLEAAGSVHRSTGSGGRTGASGRVDVYPSDDWRLTAELDSDSNRLPWRAYMEGTHGWSAGAAVRYQPNARTYLDVAYRRDDYSDGNLRHTASATRFDTWLETPRHAVATWVSGSHSRNRRTDVPYFSPRHDVTADVTAMYEWRGWRSGQSAFRQRVYGTAGAYRQANVGTRPLWEIRLEQIWDLPRRTNVTYGVGYGRRAYDGESESRLSAYFSLNVPF